MSTKRLDIGITLDIDQLTSRRADDAVVAVLESDGLQRRLLPLTTVPLGRGYSGLGEWLHRVGGNLGGLAFPALGPNVQIVLEVSHFAAGRACSEVLERSHAIRHWGVRSAIVELTDREIGRPQWDGWRLIVGRREIFGEWATTLRARTLKIDPKTLDPETISQLGQLREKAPAAGEDRREERALAVVLAIWSASPRARVGAGGFVTMRHA